VGEREFRKQEKPLALLPAAFSFGQIASDLQFIELVFLCWRRRR